MRTFSVPLRAVTLICALTCAAVQGCVSAMPLPQVQELSAEAFGCPREQVHTEVMNRSGIILARGCGHRAAYICRRTQIGTIKCLPREAEAGQVMAIEVAPRIRDKASTLLQCAADEVAIGPAADQGQGRYRATGCGKRIGYECLSQLDCCALTTPGVESADAPEPTCKAPDCERVNDDDKGDDDGKGDGDDVHVQDARGALSKRVIRETIRKDVVASVRACYEQPMTAPPYPAGVVSVKFIIGPDGTVSTAAVATASLPDPQTQRCIVKAVRGARFPKPEGGGIVVVTYPFILRTDPPWQACR